LNAVFCATTSKTADKPELKNLLFNLPTLALRAEMRAESCSKISDLSARVYSRVKNYF
jgi:hypothetical protein